MAEAAPLSIVDINFTRLHVLLRTYGTEAVRMFFDKMPDLKPAELNDSIKEWKERLLKQRNPLLTDKQKKLLGIHMDPPSGNAKAEKFDLTLLAMLLQRYAEIPPPKGGWDQLPSANEISKSADIARLKFFTEKYQDRSCADFILFDEDWDIIKGAILRLVPPNQQEDYRKRIRPLKNLAITLEDFSRVSTSHRFNSKKTVEIEDQETEDEKQHGGYDGEYPYHDREEEEKGETRYVAHAHCLHGKCVEHLRQRYLEEMEKLIFDYSLPISHSITLGYDSAGCRDSNCIFGFHSTQFTKMKVAKEKGITIMKSVGGPDKKYYIKPTPKSKLKPYVKGPAGLILYQREPNDDSTWDSSDNEELQGVGLLSKEEESHQFDMDGRSPLHLAVMQQETDVIEVLLKSGVDIEAKSKTSKMTALHYAIMTKGTLKKIELLLRYKANLHAEDSMGWTALLMSAKLGNVEISELLLKRGANVNHKDQEGWTALHIAAQIKCDEIAELLLNYGADPNVEQEDGRIPLHFAAQNQLLLMCTVMANKGANVNKADKDGVTPLHLAAAIGNAAVVESLVTNGADVTSRDNSLWTPLHFAAQRGDEETVTWLFNHGTYVDVKENMERSALFYAAQNGHIGVTRALVDRKANINLKDTHGYNPLYFAIVHKYDEIATILLEVGSDINTCDKFHMSMLHIAAYKNLLPVVQELISRGFDIDAKDKEGRTAVHFAAQQGNTSVALYLIQRGSDPMIGDHKCITALHLAATGGHVETVKMLIPFYENLDCVEIKLSWTPLMFAALGGHTKVAKCLLEHPRAPNVNFKDVKNFTPLHIAAYGGSEEFVSFLLEQGADSSLLDYHNRTAIYFARTKAVSAVLTSIGLELEVRDTDGRTPLHAAVQFQVVDICQFYINQGANVSCSDNHHIQPLHLAAKIGSKTLCELLLDAGASVHCEHKDGWQPLHFAARKGIPEVGELFIRNGANVNSAEKDNWTPLHVTSYFGNISFSKLLLKKGANLHLCQNEGRSPLHLACKAGSLSVVKLLVDHGANLKLYDLSGKLPLHLAIVYKHKKIVEYLASIQMKHESRVTDDPYAHNPEERGGSYETPFRRQQSGEKESHRRDGYEKKAKKQDHDENVMRRQDSYEKYTKRQSKYENPIKKQDSNGRETRRQNSSENAIKRQESYERDARRQDKYKDPVKRQDSYEREAKRQGIPDKYLGRQYSYETEDNPENRAKRQERYEKDGDRNTDGRGLKDDKEKDARRETHAREEKKRRSTGEKTAPEDDREQDFGKDALAEQKTKQRNIEERGAPIKSRGDQHSKEMHGVYEKRVTPHEGRKGTGSRAHTKVEEQDGVSAKQFMEGNADLFKSILMGAVEDDGKGKKDEILKLIMELKKEKKSNPADVKERQKQKKKILSLLVNTLQNSDEEDKIDCNSKSNV